MIERRIPKIVVAFSGIFVVLVIALLISNWSTLQTKYWIYSLREDGILRASRPYVHLRTHWRTSVPFLIDVIDDPGKSDFKTFGSGPTFTTVGSVASLILFEVRFEDMKSIIDRRSFEADLDGWCAQDFRRRAPSKKEWRQWWESLPENVKTGR